MSRHTQPHTSRSDRFGQLFGLITCGRTSVICGLIALCMSICVLPGCNSQDQSQATPQATGEATQTSTQSTAGTAPGSGSSLLDEEEVDYAVSTKNFIPVTIDEVNKKIEQGDTFYLYLGRETCVWCRMIAPHYQRVFDDAHLDLYYLDSTDSKENPPLQKFRDDLGLDTVPQLIAFSKTKHQVLDISTSSKQIDKDILDAMNSSIAAHPQDQ